jgi:hypothetical protein
MHGRYHRGDPRDGVGTVAWENLRHLDVGDRLEPVVGGPEQHAAQPRKAARDLEIDDLQRSVRQVLRRAEPTICRDVEGLFGLASMHEIAPCHKSSAALVHICQDCKLVVGQGDEVVEFPGKGLQSMASILLSRSAWTRSNHSAQRLLSISPAQLRI